MRDGVTVDAGVGQVWARAFHDCTALYDGKRWTELRRHFERDGYLYITGCIPAAAIQKVGHTAERDRPSCRAAKPTAAP